MSVEPRPNDRRPRIGRVLGWALLLLPVLHLATCAYSSRKNAAAFDQIQLGDPEQEVILAFGRPSVREMAGDPPLHRYSDEGCRSPCAERLWFEHRPGLDLEAWSVDLDANRRVVVKRHWVSP
ncbi:hypothetical protein [Agrilutibacter solisilvae]|uniref:Uncharacterized protein n=1 Tax=Agrilutibacter solisilvae TaxID=2763317 RepID=A0A975AT68_9GAMM|nr:hypothetical protein [Lysobacter solisilvae]QSX78983.1 hypothetical protein I8J32_003405 [Lysobacter solisilvae]